MVAIDIRLKNFFFDRKLVQSVVDKETLKFLRHAGGYGARVAKNSIKKKGKARKAPKKQGGAAWRKREAEIAQQPASKPGTPPFAHTDDPNRSLRKIIFALDTRTRSAIVGPVGFFAKDRAPTTVPELHERGGSKTIIEKRVGSGQNTRWIPLGGRARPGQPVRRRKAKYPPRPFMAPAQKATQQKFPKLWFSSGGNP